MCCVDASWDAGGSYTKLLVSVTLTSDQVSRTSIKSGAYLLYSMTQEFQIWFADASFHRGMSHIVLGHCDLDL